VGASALNLLKPATEIRFPEIQYLINSRVVPPDTTVCASVVPGFRQIRPPDIQFTDITPNKVIRAPDRPGLPIREGDFRNYLQKRYFFTHFFRKRIFLDDLRQMVHYPLSYKTLMGAFAWQTPPGIDPMGTHSFFQPSE